MRPRSMPALVAVVALTVAACGGATPETTAPAEGQTPTTNLPEAPTYPRHQPRRRRRRTPSR